MSLGAALAGGFVGTLVLTTALVAATHLRLTRIDLPFLLGTAFTANRTRAIGIGYGLHFVFGLLFATLYWLVFLAIGRAGWRLGLLFGLGHALFAGTALVNVLLPVVHPRMGTRFDAADRGALLEPPGFMLLNYGASTPLVTIAAHLAYGGIVGWFIGVGR
jgi:hypothetical protein